MKRREIRCQFLPHEPAVHHDATINLQFRHRLRFTHGALDPHNDALACAFDDAGAAAADMRRDQTPVRVLACLDAGLIQAAPELPAQLRRYVAAYADRLQLVREPMPIPGGERCKNEPVVVDELLQAIERAGLDRHSYVLAVGGGAVLDAVGFAAAIVHRGVRLVRMPTTTLSQGDSGVGVKTGVNRFNQKNYLGTFNVPWAVLNDLELLRSLHERDWRSGFSEAVKVALLKDAAFFDRLCDAGPAIVARDLDAAAPLLKRTAELHLDHIARGGDPFELGTARPLDFGHWAAHKLETMTRHALRHGEAVAIGLALDVTYAEQVGMLEAATADRVRTCLRGMGFELHHEACADVERLLEGLEEFRAHLGGALAVPMITDVAHPVNVSTIEASVLREAVARLSRDARYTEPQRLA